MNKTIVILFVAILVKFSYFFMAQSFDITVLKKNDSYWYERISMIGHERITPDQLGTCQNGIIEQSYYAFFPLYPYLIRAIVLTTGMNFNQSAFFLSCILSFILFYIFFKIVKYFFKDERLALNSTLFLILLPFHYYFSVYYTEALFLLLLLLSFYMILLQKNFLLILFSSLLILTRPNGILMLIPLTIFYLERNYHFEYRKIFTIFVTNYKRLLIFLIPFAVFLLYCLYLYYMTGSFFAFKRAQAGWCGKIVFPWMPILKASNWIDYLRLTIMFFYLIIAIKYIKKIPFSLNIMVFIGFLLPLVANSITSPRFISVIFIYPILFAKKINSNNKLLWNITLFVFIFILHLLSFQFWIQGGEMSY